MSHTIRAYNKAPILGGPGLKGWVTSNPGDQDVLKVAYDYVYRPHGYLCMGRCPRCKDWRLGSRRRQAWKAEVRQRMITDRYWADLEGFEYIDPDDPLDGLVAIWDNYCDWRDGIDYDY